MIVVELKPDFVLEAEYEFKMLFEYLSKNDLKRENSGTVKAGRFAQVASVNVHTATR